jgi:tetratricopeptide (TPR) repeat protein
MGDPAGALTAHGKALAIRERLVDAHPSVNSFQQELSISHNNIGLLLSGTGDPAGALTAYGKSLAIQQKLVDAHPNVPEYRNTLASSHNNGADVLRRLGRNAEARDGYERAIAIRERLVQDHPKVVLYRSHLAWSLRGCGLARLGLGDLAGASAITRRALALWDGLPSRSGSDWFLTACCHATLAGLAGRDGAGVSAAEREAESDQAMALLRKAVGIGYRDASGFRTESALDTLREREDFKKLLEELEQKSAAKSATSR